MADSEPSSGIVLAGGRSSRFGGDKLAAMVDGVPLLERAIAAVGEVAGEILVVGRTGGVSEDRRARFVSDRVPHQGPLAGLVAGLAAASHERAVVVAGDMPSLDPAVLRMLLANLGDSPFGIEAVALGLGSTDSPQPLPIAIRHSVLGSATRTVEGGERSLGRFLARLPLKVLPEATWRAADPAARSLVDIDVPSDLSGVEE
jgi:molybdopterin-guanine dinucleotide biosynthesis protein A